MDFTRYIENIVVYINSHLMMDHRNSIAVIASHVNKSCYLYSPHMDNWIKNTNSNSTVNIAKDGRHEELSHINYIIETRVKELVQEMATADIHNHVDQDLRNKGQAKSRILVIKCTPDTSFQYLPIMNCIFTAQKYNVPIDACVIEKDSGFLQQACDITGGIYLKLQSPSGLLQYLLTAFLPNQSMRETLILPPKAKVDYRAACFCHRELIEIGYICSVCLSISCKFVPVCPTCQTHFTLRIAKKKKKA
ncbi:General transcription factor IIH subunit 3 [Trichoplax sp. H2]|nr:General transcription factor IIH subunit 3 [Trichoplax sp. H2]|eukprot:RDD38097.1 General transcription factor IIH subunit 3 [Trichoplax sp. H2]